MKKTILMAAASTLLLAACNEKPGYEISGKVNNPALDGKYVYLCLYNEPDAAPLDSALVQNGSFTLKGENPTVALRTLRFNEDAVARSYAMPGEDMPFVATFALGNNKLQVVLDSLSNVSGSPENDALQAFKDAVRPVREQQMQVASALKSDDQPDRADIEKKYEELDNQISQKAADFIASNMNNPLAAKLFYDFRYYIPEEKQQDLAAQSSDVFKSVAGIDKLMARLENLKKVAVGKKFTDFEMKDVKGDMRKLSDYVGQGKVVLIDFWASWCPPCRKETPKLVELYKQYKGKGFEIVGISLDSKQDAWEKGIKDLHITWPQLSDLQGWKNGGAAIYSVNSIPHTILVDKDGTIIAKNIHGDEIEAKLKEALK